MKKISNLIGSSVYTINNCTNCGYVFSFTLNKTKSKITSLLIYDDNLDVNYSVPVRKVFSFNSQVMLKNETALNVIADTYLSTIINAQVFDIFGESLGRIVDIEFDDKFVIKSIITTKCSFLPKQIINYGNDLVFVNSLNTRYPLSFFKPTKKSMIKNNLMSVEVLSTIPTPKEIAAKPNS